MVERSGIKFYERNYKKELYYKFPKYIMLDPYYEKMRPIAKLAYMVLLDRHNLSVRNKWVDPDGAIFFIMTRDELGKLLKVTRNTATKIFGELKQFKLLAETRRGLGKPNMLYLLHPNRTDFDEHPPASENTEEIDDSRCPKSLHQESKKIDINMPKNDASRSEKIGIPSYRTIFTGSENEGEGEGVDGKEKEKDPPPSKKTYGENSTVELTPEEYGELVKEYGQAMVDDYILRIDQHQASKGEQYKNHVATVKKWIREDRAKEAREDKRQRQPGKNRFNNFKGRNNDYSNFDKLEREYLANKDKAYGQKVYDEQKNNEGQNDIEEEIINPLRRRKN